MSILCKVIGHKIDKHSLYYGGYYACQRCGAEDQHYLPAQWEFLAYRWWKAKEWWRTHVTDYLAKCPDCGLRFKRHDQTVKHFPF